MRRRSPSASPFRLLIGYDATRAARLAITMMREARELGGVILVTVEAA
jgi:hypothetical protein